MSEDLKQIQRTLIKFQKRAEKIEHQILSSTFVDSEPLFDQVSAPINQIIYGRRGTGKTHALMHLDERVKSRGQLAVYVDLRSIGSNGSIYSDSSRSLAERSCTLIRDVLTSIHDEFYRIALVAIDAAPDPRQITIRIDDFYEAISDVSITGDVSTEEVGITHRGLKWTGGGNLENSGAMPSGSVNISRERTNAESNKEQIKRTGREIVHINFGRVASSLDGLVRVLGVDKVWLLIDEWSEVPIELQPYLADLLRRTVIPQNNIVLKIAAIEHRSSFIIKRERGAYIGIELGADMAADLNLDDFLVFENDEEKSSKFFSALIYRHFIAIEGAPDFITSPEELISSMFTQVQSFQEFLRAVEGVPRDALNLATKLASQAWGQKVSVNHIRKAAKDWYNQDKSNSVKDNAELNGLLTRIIDIVIGNRRTRAFLIGSTQRDSRIDALFDARVLHILKKNISSHDEPGSRFDVYKIDYGCYVDLINTSKAPLGLFQVAEGEYVEVPKDDYRSIRRAILRPEEIGHLENDFSAGS